MGAERAGPLLILAGRLRSLGPPSLSSLIAWVEQGEDYRDFVALVREFLPEYEREILARGTPAGHIEAFADRFQDRYFPLHQYMRGEVDCYSDLTSGIPVEVHGVTWDDYHYIADDWRLGYQLITYVLADPYAESETRIALAEACAKHVPQALLERVPEGGISREVAQGLRGTFYQGLAHWAAILNHDTGNFFLHATYEDLGYEALDWNRETVEGLTQDWQQAEAIQEEISNLVEWLEGAALGRFRELLDFLEERGMV